ncbi:MAG: thiamine pyrophosphate-dependent enzyme [Anaerolineae bacterium]
MTSARHAPAPPLASLFAAPLRGDQALAYGALAAGVSLVTGYPGSPATPVFDAILSAGAAGERVVQWAPNEKVAMEMAMGASLAGQRSLVVLKSVGLNIGLDPLATFSLSGCFGGLVILLGDDPGGWGSQNEQDTRWLARVAEVPVIEPGDITQAANLMVQAYAWSEAHGLPIIVRITNSYATERALVEPPWTLPPPQGFFVHKRDRWVVLPATVVKRHRSLHRHLRDVQRDFDGSPYDRASGDGALGVVAVGHTLPRVRQALAPGALLSLLSLTSVWPLPESSLLRWLDVIEEGGPFVEQGLRALLQRQGANLVILGREDRAVPEEGELTVTDIAAALEVLSSGLSAPTGAASARAMPSRVPLCEGCGYTPLFEALIAAMEAHGGRARHIVVGETGCMVRANLPPMELFDVKYGLGASLGMGLGLALSTDPKRQRVVCLVGDSSFFHTNVNAVPQVVQAGIDMTVIILDNGVTALTGGQVHPGTPRDERGVPRAQQDVVPVLEAYGIAPIVVSPGEPEAMARALGDGLDAAGPAFIVARVPCPRYAVHGEGA